VTFVHTHSTFPSRLAPVSWLGASRVCSALPCYTSRVPMDLELTQDPLRPLPAHAARGVLATGVIRAHTSHLAATRGVKYPPDCLIRHAVITSDVPEGFPLIDPLEDGRPGRGRDLPARVRDGLRVARQRQKPRMVKGRGERIDSG